MAPPKAGQTVITLNEDVEIVQHLDAIATQEGTSRSALIRRAIRQLILSAPNIPIFGNIQDSVNQQEKAA